MTTPLTRSALSRGSMSSVSVISLISVPPENLFAEICKVENYPQRVGSLKIELTGPAFPLKRGAEYELSVERWGIKQFWHLQVETFDPPHRLVFRQSLGVFSQWTHSFLLTKFDDSTTKLEQSVDYKVPLGIIGRLYDDLALRRLVKKVLEDFAASFSSDQKK